MKLRLEGQVPEPPPPDESAAAGEAPPQLRVEPEALLRAFQVLQSVDAVVSLQEIAGTDRLIDEAAAAGAELSYALLLREVRL